MNRRTLRGRRRGSRERERRLHAARLGRDATTIGRGQLDRDEESPDTLLAAIRAADLAWAHVDAGIDLPFPAQDDVRCVPADPVIEPGTVLQGTYQVVRRIGSGGMGEVYEARHTRLPGRFAVKVLSARLESSAEDVLRFRREAEIISSLGHPHIIHVVDFNQTPEGAPYLVMEYVAGIDLAAELARGGRLSAERTANIVGQIAAALASAHARGVVHRDLKPQNVLVTNVRSGGGDFVKVVDFGISKVKAATTLTHGAVLLGTPQYMAPEQARGTADDVDSRTDQFALAVVAYEMLTGRLPFKGENVPAVLFSITNDDPPPMPELPRNVRRAIEAVLRRAMRKQKDDRYHTILDFSDALAAAIERRDPKLGGAAAAVSPPVGVPTESSPLAGQHRARRVRGPIRSTVLVGGAGLLVIGVLMVRHVRPGGAPNPDPVVGRLGTSLTTPDSQLPSLVTSRDVRTVPETADPDAAIPAEVPSSTYPASPVTARARLHNGVPRPTNRRFRGGKGNRADTQKADAGVFIEHL